MCALHRDSSDVAFRFYNKQDDYNNNKKIKSERVMSPELPTSTSVGRGF